MKRKLSNNVTITWYR